MQAGPKQAGPEPGRAAHLAIYSDDVSIIQGSRSFFDKTPFQSGGCWQFKTPVSGLRAPHIPTPKSGTRRCWLVATCQPEPGAGANGHQPSNLLPLPSLALALPLRPRIPYARARRRRPRGRAAAPSP
jgi:hypothetical protein